MFSYQVNNATARVQTKKSPAVPNGKRTRHLIYSIYQSRDVTVKKYVYHELTMHLTPLPAVFNQKYYQNNLSTHKFDIL